MSFTQFNKQNMNHVRAEINRKLEELEQLGLNIKLGNISYTDTNFTAKIECSLVGGPSKFETEFKRSFEFRNHPNAIGKTVEINGKKFIFCGFIPRARKNHAAIEDMNGKSFRCNFDSIKGQL